jgi:hypothetical protein
MQIICQPLGRPGRAAAWSSGRFASSDYFHVVPRPSGAPVRLMSLENHRAMQSRIRPSPFLGKCRHLRSCPRLPRPGSALRPRVGNVLLGLGALSRLQLAPSPQRVQSVPVVARFRHPPAAPHQNSFARKSAPLESLFSWGKSNLKIVWPRMQFAFGLCATNGPSCRSRRILQSENRSDAGARAIRTFGPHLVRQN